MQRVEEHFRKGVSIQCLLVEINGKGINNLCGIPPSLLVPLAPLWLYYPPPFLRVKKTTNYTNVTNEG